MGCCVIKKKDGSQIVHATRMPASKVRAIAQALGIEDRQLTDPDIVESILIYIGKPPSSGSP
jgi:hypothetical protein